MSSELSKAYANLAKSARVRGFRPGKAPKKVLAHYFGPRVSADVAQRLVDDTFQNVSLIDERTLEITYRKDRTNAGRVLASLTAAGLTIVDVSTRDPDLEDVFLSLTAAAQDAA